MGLKDNNEITVKVMCSLDELVDILTKKGFKKVDEYMLDDYYLIPKVTEIKNSSSREILTKAVIIRNVINLDVVKRMLVFKNKEFAENGDILSQESIECSIFDLEDAKKFLNAIGYCEVMNIKEDDTIFSKDNLELSVKNIRNGNLLIEIETDPESELDTIDKLKIAVDKLEIPIYKDNYFVKKAEIELDKIIQK